MTVLKSPPAFASCADPAAMENPEDWYTTTMVGIPARIIGSTAFNRSLRRLAIHGTRETHPGLFHLLDGCASQDAAAQVFEHYLALHFALGTVAGSALAGQGDELTSYVEMLRGWGMDSNCARGAVLKGWVESRFGLVPVYHKEALGGFPSPAWAVYLAEKTNSRFHNNCIYHQLDLLYEYCQWSIRRFKTPGPRFIRLWRGTNNYEEQLVEPGGRLGRVCEVRLNNLVSFSRSQERAEEFGDWVLETEVPTCKILFFPGLLRDRVLNSEGECLVIGGRFKVRAYHGYI